MSLRSFGSIALLLTFGLSTTLGAESKVKKKGYAVRTPAPIAAPTPASDPNLVTYYLGIITKGARFDGYTREGREKIQRLHVENLNRLADAGKLLVAGPIIDNGTWRGIFIYKCDSLKEAQELAAADPAVQAGRFHIEVHPWMTEKGYIRDPEFPVVR